MASSASIPPSFHCRQCGTCCRWPGSVLLTPDDIAAASAVLGLAEAKWIEKFTELARNRAQLTLKSQVGGACIFLDPAGHCRIYAARPRQCRTFPHGWQVEGCPGLEPAPPELPRS